MIPELTREEIERLRDDFALAGELEPGEVYGLLSYAEAEPARVAEARAEGVREIEDKIGRILANDAECCGHPVMLDGYGHGCCGCPVERDPADILSEIRAALAPAPAEASAPVAEGCMCQKCGARYRVDVLVSDDVWARIADGRNMLCGQCIVDAIERDEFAAYRLVEVDAIAALEAEVTALREREAGLVEGLRDLLTRTTDGATRARARALLHGQEVTP